MLQIDHEFKPFMEFWGGGEKVSCLATYFCLAHVGVFYLSGH